MLIPLAKAYHTVPTVSFQLLAGVLPTEILLRSEMSKCLKVFAGKRIPYTNTKHARHERVEILLSFPLRVIYFR